MPTWVYSLLNRYSNSSLTISRTLFKDASITGDDGHEEEHPG